MDRLPKDLIQRVVDRFDYKDCRKTVLLKSFSSMIKNRMSDLRYYHCNRVSYSHISHLINFMPGVKERIVEFEPDNGENILRVYYYYKTDLIGRRTIENLSITTKSVPKDGMISKTPLYPDFFSIERQYFESPTIGFVFYLETDGYAHLIKEK